MELIKASLLSAVMQSGGGGNVAPKPDTIVANGTYTASTDHLDGYSSVLVDVPSGSFERIINTPSINGGGFMIRNSALQSCYYTVHRCAIGRCDQEEWVYSATTYAGHDAAIDSTEGSSHNLCYCYPWLRSIHHSKPFWVVLRYGTTPILAVMSRIGQIMQESDGEIYWQKKDGDQYIELPDGTHITVPSLSTYIHDKYTFRNYNNTSQMGNVYIDSYNYNRMTLSVTLSGTVDTNHMVHDPNDDSETTTPESRSVSDIVPLIYTGGGNTLRAPQIWCADADLAHSALEAILGEALERYYSATYPSTWKIHFS